MARDVVLLFHPRTFHERNYRYFHVPYSLLSVASGVDRSRHEVILIDNNVTAQDDFTSLLGHVKNRLLCVGISAMIGHQISDGLAFATSVRTVERQVPLIWGGAAPTLLPQLFIQHDMVDVVVRGQGQGAFPEVLAALETGGSLAGVRGITYKENGKLRENPDRPFADFGLLPPFASTYDLVNLTDYIRFDEHINLRTVSYHSSQGCPFSCGYCAEVALWKRRWSGFTTERILMDLEHLITMFDVNGIKFYDAEFFIKQERVLDFARGIVDRGLRLKWAAAVHPANLDRFSEDQLALLEASGVSRLLMGAESGVEEELALVGKRTNRDMVLRLAQHCSRHGITASFSFVVGYPGSPPENIPKTLDFAAELMQVDARHEAKVHFYAPYPGTPLYPEALKHGFVPPASLEEWSTYDYYDVTTPWIDKAWEPIVRAFNEQHYPYLGPEDKTTEEQVPVKVCPLL